MAWYVALKDIASFYKAERRVFIWLIISMVICSFVINYSYSFARYRGNLYDENMGEDVPVYKVSSTGNTDISLFGDVFLDMEAAGLPKITGITYITGTKDGLRAAGSEEISPKDFRLTGAWIEGYAVDITNDGQKVCAVNENLLDYGDNLKMTGETYCLDGEDFTIGGVYESFNGAADIVIFADKFKEKYGCFDEAWLTFERGLDQDEEKELEAAVKKHIGDGSISYIKSSGGAGKIITASNQMQYSIIIVLLVIFLASILQYWYDVNLPTYNVYWMTGASSRKILGAVFCETLMLCAGSYLAGLLLNVIFRQAFTENMPLTLYDVMLGFCIFFGTMLALGLVNMGRICRTFSVKNIT